MARHRKIEGPRAGRRDARGRRAGGLLRRHRALADHSERHSHGGQKKHAQDKPNRTQVAEKTPPAPSEEAEGITIAAVGDTMLGNTPELPPEPSTYLDPVKEELNGDVVFGNLEGTLTEVAESPKCEGAKSGECYAFRAPPEYAGCPRRSRLHLDVERQQPLARLRRNRADGNDRRRCTKRGSNRPGCPARSRSSRRTASGSPSSASRPTPGRPR